MLAWVEKDIGRKYSHPLTESQPINDFLRYLELKDQCVGRADYTHWRSIVASARHRKCGDLVFNILSVGLLLFWQPECEALVFSNILSVGFLFCCGPSSFFDEASFLPSLSQFIWSLLLILFYSCRWTEACVTRVWDLGLSPVTADSCGDTVISCGVLWGGT